jgi:hypothetical protein
MQHTSNRHLMHISPSAHLVGIALLLSAACSDCKSGTSSSEPTATDAGAESPPGAVTGTPVIDRAAELLYVVSKSKRADGTYVQRLHALHLVDGTEKTGAPVVIAAQVRGTSSDAVDGVLSFEALRHNQRAALALANGRVGVARRPSAVSRLADGLRHGRPRQGPRRDGDDAGRSRRRHLDGSKRSLRRCRRQHLRRVRQWPVRHGRRRDAHQLLALRARAAPRRRQLHDQGFFLSARHRDAPRRRPRLRHVRADLAPGSSDGADPSPRGGRQGAHALRARSREPRSVRRAAR